LSGVGGQGTGVPYNEWCYGSSVLPMGGGHQLRGILILGCEIGIERYLLYNFRVWVGVSEALNVGRVVVVMDSRCGVEKLMRWVVIDLFCDRSSGFVQVGRIRR